MYQVIIFVRDWEAIPGLFASEKEAEEWVEKYPQFGGIYSRAIRQGNWQTINVQ